MMMAEVYYQRRIPFYSMRYFLAAAVLTGVLFGVDPRVGFGETLLASLLTGLVAAAAVLVFLMVFIKVLQLGEGARIRVTDEALHVGWRRVPIEQIVSVSEVPARQVRRSILSYRVGQRKVGWVSKVVSYDTTTAVVVRDGRRERRPWWFIDVDDPDRFIEAIRTAQANARERERDG